MPHDLTPIEPGEFCDFSIEGDYCSSVEDLTQFYEPGQCEPISMSDTDTTIFTEKLAILKCGLMIKEKDTAKVQASNDPKEIAEIDKVMEIGEQFKLAHWVGAASSRFAPVLFENPSQETSTLKALVSSLGIKITPVFNAVPDLRFFFINGTDAVAEGTIWVKPISVDDLEMQDQRWEQIKRLVSAPVPAGVPRILTSVMIEEPRFHMEVEKSEKVFAYLRDVLTIIPAFSEEEGYGYMNNPVFCVGLTPNGRLGGLMANHVD